MDGGNARQTASTADLAAVADFRSALRHFNQATDEITRRHGLTGPRYELLLLIASAAEERPRVSALARRMYLKPHTTVELIARAERSGLVRREDDPRDRRVTRVCLTAEGESRLSAAVQGLEPERERLMGLLAEAVRRARRTMSGAL